MTQAKEIKALHRRQARAFCLLGNNKGLECPFWPITGQDGYCSECQRYLVWLRSGEIVVMCDSCGKVLKRDHYPGRSVVSAGICRECRKKYFPET
jgi:ribosomal protein S27E